MNYTTRTVDWVIQKAFGVGEGKSSAPALGSNKYNLLIELVDNEQKDWADEQGVQWNSLYQPITLAALIQANVATYALDMTVGDPSLYFDDKLILTPAGGGTQEYAKFIRPDQLTQYSTDLAAAIEKRNLVFSQAFSPSDALIGGTIQIPNYGYVNDLANATDIVQVDNPMYLVYMTAAAFIMNDIIKAGNYNLMLAKAAELMAKMKELNDAHYDQAVNDPVVQGMSWV
jgi:hypothetical protein